MVVALSAGADGQHPALHQRQARARGPELPAPAAGADPGRDQRRHHLPGAGDGDRQAAGRLHAGRRRPPAPRHGQEDQGRDGRPARGVRRRARSQRGIDAKLADTIFDAVAKFASYGFNKSHAAAYALLAYQTAWLKANHPVEFFAAAMTTERGQPGEARAPTARRCASAGIPLYPPDVNHPRRASWSRTAPSGAGVRYALAAIKGVGAAAIDALVEERAARGPFRDVFDLMARLGTRVLNKRLLESLVRAGALGLAGRPTGAALVDGADAAPALCRRGGRGGARAIRSACSAAAAPAQVPKPPLPAVEDWPALERLQMEFDVLGLYLSAHPLDGYRDGAGAAGRHHRRPAARRSRARAAGAAGRRGRQQAGAGDRADAVGPPDRLRPYRPVRDHRLQRADGPGARAAGRRPHRSISRSTPRSTATICA